MTAMNRALTGLVAAFGSWLLASLAPVAESSADTNTLF